MRFLGLCTIFLFVWCLSGCASRQIAQPQIALVDLQLGDVTLLETGLEAIVRIDNEGQQPLRLSGAVYRLYLNDIDVGRGMSSKAVTVPRLGSATQKVVFRLSNISLISRIVPLFESNQFSYKISGHVYLPGSFGYDRKVAVERSSRFNLK